MIKEIKKSSFRGGPSRKIAQAEIFSKELDVLRQYFDIGFYLSSYVDVAESEDVDPLEHYCVFGWKERRDPSADFSTGYYLDTNPDVHSAGINPFFHYLTIGKNEGRDAVWPEKQTKNAAVEDFDLEYYACVNQQLADIPDAQLKSHFINHGYAAGLVYAPPSKARAAAQFKPRSANGKTHPPVGGRPQYSSPLIIAGFHRSGTSMTANLFHNAGLFLGKKLLGANDSNPFGHFEAEDVVAFHDSLLAASGTYWQTDTDFVPVMNSRSWMWLLNYAIRHGNKPTWGFKDPRNSLFMPQWAEVFPDMRVLYVYRPAVECVYSIKRRAARDLFRGTATHINRRFWMIDDLAVKMYIIYATAFLRFAETFNGDLCVVELDDIIDGRDIVSEVREHWNYQLSDAYIGDIYDSSVMSRAGPNEPIKDPRLLEQLAEVEEKLRALSRRGFTGSNTPKTLMEF
jgi:hypothetical protein